MSNEDELQNRVELGETENSLDSKAYQIVFNGLKNERHFELPEHFADHILSLVEAQRRTAFTWWEKLFFIAGSSVMLILFIVVVVLTGFSLKLGFLKAIGPYSGVFAFAIFLIGLLNFLDSRFVRRKLHH